MTCDNCNDKRNLILLCKDCLKGIKDLAFEAGERKGYEQGMRDQQENDKDRI